MKLRHKKMARSAMRSQGKRLWTRIIGHPDYLKDAITIRSECQPQHFKALYRWYFKFR